MKPIRNGTYNAPQSLHVAYHEGPPAIHFAGLSWRRGEPQEITRAQWDAMRARGDFAPFDFKLARTEAPASDLSKE